MRHKKINAKLSLSEEDNEIVMLITPNSNNVINHYHIHFSKEESVKILDWFKYYEK